MSDYPLPGTMGFGIADLVAVQRAAVALTRPAALIIACYVFR